MIMPTDLEAYAAYRYGYQKRKGAVGHQDLIRQGLREVLHLIRARAVARFFWPCLLSTALALLQLGLGIYDVWHGEYARALFAAAGATISAAVSIKLSLIANEFISIADLDEPEAE